jgi:hypothetical protein
VTILPSEGPSESGRCNYDTLSPNRSSNVAVMNRGSADEAVVIVKFDAGESMVTWTRIKHRTSGRKPEVKGGTRKRPRPLIIDWRSEISLIGATDYLRRKQ